MQTFWQDLRYGARMLAKKPGFTLIAIVTLALGIGANTAIFSVVNGVLLNPLPFAESSRLMDLTEIRGDQMDGTTSYPNFVDWRNQQSVFEGLAIYRDHALTLVGQGEPAHLQTIVASAELFSLLKTEPALGRNFLPEEDEAGNHVVMLSHTAWQKHFASDPQIVGKQLALSGKSFTVVGVMPASFKFPIRANPVDLWTTPAIDAEKTAPNIKPETEQRGHRDWSVIARLKANATEPQAQAEMNTIEARLIAQYPNYFVNHRIEVKPFIEKLTGKIKPALLVLFAAVGFVLLIACANVANLLLARAVTRQKEIAVRSALGASRWRIVRQLLTESALLSVIGGGLGILLAVWGTDLLKFLSPADLPRVKEIRIDGRVLVFTMLISLLTGIIFGLVPALRASRTDLNETLKEGGRRGSESLRRNRTRSALVIAEVALALMLLVGAGLLINSFVHLQKVDPGFDAHNVLTMTVDLPTTKYKEPQQLINFYRQLVERVESLPGVGAAGMVYPLPLSGNDEGTSFDVEGQSIEDAKRPRTHLRWTSIGYFRAMSIQLIKGRDFNEHDDRKAQPVAIINETLARRFFPNEDPIGKRIMRSASRPYREIIGVVADVKHASLGEESGLEVYLPYSQAQYGAMALVVRAETEPLSLLNAVRSEVSGLDKEVAIDDVKTLDQYRADAVAQPRFNTMLLTIFASVAMILTAIGLYGVMAYSVAQRTHEIGIRMALGAQSGDVQKLIIGQGIKLTLIGVTIGLIAAVALTRLMASLLYGVSATDPLTFVVIALLLTAVAMLACYLPARRATKVDPMVALRYE